MPRLFLIPVISIFDVHDAAVREWLSRLDDDAIRYHLEYPFKLDRFFPESSRQALKRADEVNNEIIRLLDVIDPRASFLDISIDFVELENRYNERLISPQEFWYEYYELISSDMTEAAKTIYRIYIKEIIDRNIRLIESKEKLPLSVVFYGLDTRSRETIIPVYEEVFDKDGEFLLRAARTINELTSFRETPEHIWYSSMKVRQMAISYEETEKFYDELLSRLRRLLTFKVRSYVVKSLKEQAQEFVLAYESFLDHKLIEEEMHMSNIIEGIRLLTSQSDYPDIVIYCGPMHYSYLMDSLRTTPGVTIGDADIALLLEKMRPYTQKNRIMQSNYDIALNITGRKKPEKYDTPGAVLVPT